MGGCGGVGSANSHPYSHPFSQAFSHGYLTDSTMFISKSLPDPLNPVVARASRPWARPRWPCYLRARGTASVPLLLFELVTALVVWSHYESGIQTGRTTRALLAGNNLEAGFAVDHIGLHRHLGVHRAGTRRAVDSGAGPTTCPRERG